MKLARILSASMIFAILFGLAPVALAASLEGEIELEPAEHETVFGYSGSIGPAFWGELDDAWALCADGLEQSPIDIRALAAQMHDGDDLTVDYHASPIEFVNNGHTVQMNYEPGSSITLGGEEYELLQFHFHTPSEHTLGGGATFPLELHLVHRSTSGELAVIGVMIREGELNRALPSTRRLRQYLPTAEGVVIHIGERSLNAAGLLPDDLTSYRYGGSLTTPPCSEGVRWIVLATPIELSRGQVRAIRNALGQLAYASAEGTNARPTQPLNGRTVELDAD